MPLEASNAKPSQRDSGSHSPKGGPGQEIQLGGGVPPPQTLLSESVTTLEKSESSTSSGPNRGLTILQISQDICEDFQIPLLDRVLKCVVEVDDSQVVRQSVEKLLKYLEDGNQIPPEYLTDERVVFWAKLKDKFRFSGKFDDIFLQKIHKIWTLWDEAATAYEEANHSDEKRSPNGKKAFKIKARNGKASKHPYKRQRLCFETKEGKESRDTTAQPSMTDRRSRGKVKFGFEECS